MQSTDEQAEKGYSLRSQKDVLEKYCFGNGILVRKIYTEDHSAKTFNRPEWRKFITFLKKTKKNLSLVLFTKWDRFSRNASDAYQMISLLKKLGSDPQAIEQPLDMDVPENKMMLAIYLTAPEIENDRRGLNTRAGIRQAKKEGRWTGPAPLGYINRTHLDGKKFITPKHPESELIKWIFSQIEKDTFSCEETFRMAIRKGLKCSKNNFYHLIKNPVYYGKVIVPKYRDEEMILVTGNHDPLIEKKQFWNVQDILSKKARKKGTSLTVPEDLPLRGFLNCTDCTRKLTGSARRGSKKPIFYYHCRSECGVRFRADTVLIEFRNCLAELNLREEFKPFIKIAIDDCYSNEMSEIIEDRKMFIRATEAIKNKLTKARNLLLEGELELAEYRQIKLDCSENTQQYEDRWNAKGKRHKLFSQDYIIKDAAMNLINDMAILFCECNIEEKRELLSLLVDKTLKFEGKNFGQKVFNDDVHYIFMENHQNF
ncbi:recombinase family protein [Pedobacter fastidiosus]|uniref:Recombinase family protein n=2 Tax=Pedobacter fastidiosus TaxID=2765361 RepID=A0ABR7KXN3_9SPHI|nr:recombinase family protein [Pedobacter fastidiosus]